MAALPRECRVCRERSAPVLRAACARCWKSMPPALATKLHAAWKGRVLDPVLWEESLLTVLLWRRDYAAPPAPEPRRECEDIDDQEAF